MTYTINGKEYTEFDINKRCAELMLTTPVSILHDCQQVLSAPDLEYNPCRSPWDANRIIDKCWDELMFADYRREVRWDAIVQQHNCTKLTAACICFIEMNTND